jgi:predicted translin family RNA/ssDNA-binding protein
MPMTFAADSEEEQQVWIYGTKENAGEINKKMSRLILSVEMENWEKAEQFMEAVRKLTEGAPKEVKSAVLRMKMAVQKEDYEKTSAAYESLQGLLE